MRFFVTWSPAPAPVSSGFRVLLAEDDPVNAELLTLGLQALGCAVTRVDNGRGAVEAFLGPDVFDLVLMDRQMPSMDGLEATRQIRAHDTHTPIVGCTATLLQADAEACLDAGMSQVMRKPVRLDELRALVKKVA